MKNLFVQRCFLVLCCFLSLTSCQLFSSDSESVPVAKVHNTYLYEDDLKHFHIPSGLTEKDSVGLLTEQIDDWATQELIMFQAKENMTLEQQQQFDHLIKKYARELYTSAYKNVYTEQQLNTAIEDAEIAAYYESHKNSFLLKEELVKVRYIEVPKNFKDLTATKKLLNRYKEEDEEEIEKMLPGFTSSYLNDDDDWMAYQDLQNRIPALTDADHQKILRTNSVTVVNGEKSKYLLKVYEILKVGKIAPLVFVTEDIKQMILNKRKLELQKKLEKEIISDALQTKDYVIYQ